jgi:hypothetical protein
VDFIYLEEIVYHALSFQLTRLQNKNAFVTQGIGFQGHNVLQFVPQNLNGTVQSALAFLVSTSFRIRVFLATLTAFTVLHLRHVYAKTDTLELLVSALLAIAVVRLVRELGL